MLAEILILAITMVISPLAYVVTILYVSLLISAPRCINVVCFTSLITLLFTYAFRVTSGEMTGLLVLSSIANANLAHRKAYPEIYKTDRGKLYKNTPF